MPGNSPRPQARRPENSDQGTVPGFSEDSIEGPRNARTDVGATEEDIDEFEATGDEDREASHEDFDEMHEDLSIDDDDSDFDDFDENDFELDGSEWSNETH